MTIKHVMFKWYWEYILMVVVHGAHSCRSEGLNNSYSPLNEIDIIFQTSSKCIICNEGFRILLTFVPFLSVKLTINRHWFSEWLGTKQAISNYLNQCWPSTLTHFTNDIKSVQMIIPLYSIFFLTMIITRLCLLHIKCIKQVSSKRSCKGN